MLRINIEIDGDKTEFNILENDYDTGTTENYNSQSSVNLVGSLSEPLEERSAESVIIFEGDKDNSSAESIAQISNVICSDIVYDESKLESDLSDGMYNSAECGVYTIASDSYEKKAHLHGVKWSGSEVVHLASSSFQNANLVDIDLEVSAAKAKAYRYMNRVESKVNGKSISVVLDGYEV